MIAIYTGHTPARAGKPALETQNIASATNQDPVLRLARFEALGEAERFRPGGRHRRPMGSPGIFELPLDGDPHNTRWILNSG
jgi:hypothetical protein